MRRTKKENKEKKKTRKKIKKEKKRPKNMLCYQKREPPNLQELGTVPPIGPLSYQLWFFGVKKKGPISAKYGKT